jgi:hypothetical protein
MKCEPEGGAGKEEIELQIWSRIFGSWVLEYTGSVSQEKLKRHLEFSISLWNSRSTSYLEVHPAEVRNIF